jgi:DNA polymerase-3 subunit epsilon
MREITLDTETTGLEVSAGHRVIEIGCVELLHRRPTGERFHAYLQPGRPVDPAAMEVHGITDEFLVDKPCFSDVAQAFLDFVAGARLIIHNAPFDLGFLDNELSLLEDRTDKLEDHCTVLDTLALARRMNPGQRASLDALCKRFGIDNTRREFHGALLDARILADVYLAMTSGQVSLALEGHPHQGTRSGAGASGDPDSPRRGEHPPLAIV